MQSRLASLIEANINTFSAFIISWLLLVYLIPLIFPHIQPSHAEGVGVVGIFTAVSIIRNYFIRRLFNYLHLRRGEATIMPRIPP